MPLTADSVDSVKHQAPVRILHLEDSALDGELVAEHLRGDGIDCDIHRVWTRDSFGAALASRDYDLILADHQLPGFDGEAALAIARDVAPTIPFIFVSGTLGEDIAVESLKHGATDYVVKQRLDRLPRVSRRALAEAQSRREQARSQAALRESEERLRFAVQAGRMAEVTFHLADDGVTHSAAFARLFGHPADARMTLEQIRATYHSEDHERVLAERDRILQSDQRFYEVEHRIVCPDGSVRWIYGRGEVKRGPDGKAREVVVLYLDDTRRKEAEQALVELNGRLEQLVAERTEALRLSEARMRSIFETSYQYQCLLAPDGTLRDANAMSLAGIAQPLAAIAGRKYWETPWFAETPDVADRVRAAVQQAAEARSSRWEIVLNLPVGQRHFDFSMRPILDPQARVTAIVAEAVDITERHKAEEALRQSQKLEALGQLTGGVAHDFNNLLTPILGSLDLLQRQDLGGERHRRLIDGALKSAERARTLVHRLLAFARRQPLQLVPVDVRDLLEGLVDLIGSTLGPKVTVKLETAERLPAALADRNQLELALLNLSVNARDAMPDGGVLTISAGEAVAGVGDANGLAPGLYVRLAVEDTGCGMDADTLARAIEPFFSTKGVGQGTGLGLSMVHGLASQMGGTLQIRSEPGDGTEVALWLPVSAAAPRPTIATSAGQAEPGGAKVLLVDDDALARISTADMLRDIGYDVHEAQSAEDALLLLEEDRFDILITDHLMPGMSGIELGRAVRARWSGTRVVIASGFAEAELEANLPRITKPFRRRELEEVLSSIW